MDKIKLLHTKKLKKNLLYDLMMIKVIAETKPESELNWTWTLQKYRRHLSESAKERHYSAPYKFHDLIKY
jgi:hypothetical protein